MQQEKNNTSHVCHLVQLAASKKKKILDPHVRKWLQAAGAFKMSFHNDLPSTKVGPLYQMELLLFPLWQKPPLIIYLVATH